MSTWAKPGVKCAFKGIPTGAEGLFAYNIRMGEFDRAPLPSEILTITEVIELGIGGTGLRFAEIGCRPDRAWEIYLFEPLVPRTIEDDLAIFTPLLDTVEEDA